MRRVHKFRLSPYVDVGNMREPVKMSSISICYSYGRPKVILLCARKRITHTVFGFLCGSKMFSLFMKSDD